MTYKWIGALLIILGCGGCGFRMAAEHRRLEKLLRDFQQILSFMECELQYRLTPLPELCRHAGGEVSGSLRQVFRELSEQLDGGTVPEVADCMKSVLNQHRELPQVVRRLLHQLGKTLGRFDLPGQLQGLQAVQKACKRECRQLSEHREERMRNYQTLGLCTGTALVILFA